MEKVGDEWITPPEVIVLVRDVLGKIGLDPASTTQANMASIEAGRFYTKEDDGLVLPWNSKTLWLNPPYSNGLIQKFVEKFLIEFAAKKIGRAILLTNSATDTRWCQELLRFANAVCFKAGRIRFIAPVAKGFESWRPKAPRYANLFFYFGDLAGSIRFQAVFRREGIVLLPRG